jgi:hypothetical protein
MLVVRKDIQRRASLPTIPEAIEAWILTNERMSPHKNIYDQKPGSHWCELLLGSLRAFLLQASPPAHGIDYTRFQTKKRRRMALSSFARALLVVLDDAAIQSIAGGWGGIRTLETLARLPVFKTGAFNHSATHP